MPPTSSIFLCFDDPTSIFSRSKISLFFGFTWTSFNLQVDVVVRAFKIFKYIGPVSKIGKIYMKDMFIDSSHYPQFVPVGEYRIETNFFTYMKEEFVLLIQVKKCF